MTRLVLLIAVSLGLSLAPALAAPGAGPTVVELYQSQGCSSCPPANAVLNALADRPDLLALSFAVTYWDRLGWKDRFARPAFTRRQWDYAGYGGRDRVATPQMIVNGAGVLTGNRRADVETAIARFTRRGPAPSLTVEDGKALVGASPTGAPATLWLVRYDPRTVNVAIGRGENAGRTLPHRNIVHDLVALATWHGKPIRIALPPSRGQLAGALLLQQGKGGPILAARKL